MHTQKQYVTLQQAFDHFNKVLFPVHLGQALITLQRHAKSRGYFAPLKFQGRADDKATTHEIALNPDTFHGRSDKEIFSTLVHEMVHMSQEDAGTAPRRSYHNKAWADQMEAVGLMPSDTAEPGGKRTGQRVSHYIIDGGPFDKACDVLLKKGCALVWESRELSKAEKKKATRTSKQKFTCEECEANAWGKPDLNIICGDCKCVMVEA